MPSLYQASVSGTLEEDDRQLAFAFAGIEASAVHLFLST
jgi:hypothetical protein